VSIRDQIPSLEALAAIDADIRRAEEQIGKQRGNLEGMRAEAKELDTRLKADRDMLAQMERTRSDLSVEVRQMTTQIEKSREKLQRSRNEKETNAAQREIEELRKLHRDREDDIEKLTNAIEGAKKSIEGTDAKYQSVMRKMEGSEEGAVKQLNELEALRTARLKDREDAVKKVPVALYRRYERIRGQRPNAIAVTHDGTCSACHLTLPPMMFRNMVPQAQFDQCPHCKRIIYYSPAPIRAVEGDEASPRV